MLLWTLFSVVSMLWWSLPMLLWTLFSCMLSFFLQGCGYGPPESPLNFFFYASFVVADRLCP